jgi:hypothetical protein
MMKSIFVLVLIGISTTAVSAVPPADDPVRVFADSMAQAMTEKKDSVLYENMSPAMIEAYGKEKLVAPLKQIRSLFGDILSYEIRQATVGTAVAGARTLRTATVWYALKTTKRESGSFLQISVTKEGGRLFLARYFVSEFVGNKIPPHLQGTRSPETQHTP